MSDTINICKSLRNDFFRDKAQDLLMLLQDAKAYLSCHKPSYGFYGESVLRCFLASLLPQEVGIGQGFISKGYISSLDKNRLSEEILNEKTILGGSPQCDIILYRKVFENEIKSFGDIKIIPSRAVLAIIEVKTSVDLNSFTSTLNNFKILHDTYCVEKQFLFIFNKRSIKTLENYFYGSHSHSSNQYLSSIGSQNHYKYDHSNVSELPIGIVCLEGNYYLRQDYLCFDRDAYGYKAYRVTDNESKKISTVSCLQLFFSDLTCQIIDNNACDNNLLDFETIDSIKILDTIELFDL